MYAAGRAQWGFNIRRLPDSNVNPRRGALLSARWTQVDGRSGERPHENDLAGRLNPESGSYETHNSPGARRARYRWLSKARCHK